MYKETNFELISTGETSIDRTSAKDAGCAFRPCGPLDSPASIVEHPTSDVTRDVSVNGTLDTSAFRAGSR